MSEIIKKWGKMCREHNRCSECPLGKKLPSGLISSGLQCIALREMLENIADVLEEITDVLKKVEEATEEKEQ